MGNILSGLSGLGPLELESEGMRSGFTTRLGTLDPGLVLPRGSRVARSLQLQWDWWEGGNSDRSLPRVGKRHWGKCLKHPRKPDHGSPDTYLEGDLQVPKKGFGGEG